MEERVVELYRTRGAGIYARCRRLLGDDAAAIAATPRVFAAVQERLDDGAFVDRVAREVCARQRRLLLVPPAPQPSAEELAAAEERFARDVFKRTLPQVMRDQRPPRILRWVFYYAPVVVAAAACWMVYVVFYQTHPGRYGGGGRVAAIEVYRDRGGATVRLATGMRVKHGERLHVVVVPAGHRFVTVHANARVVARLGPLTPDAARIPLAEDIPVEDEGRLRLSADFGSSPRMPPAWEDAVEIEVD